VVALSSACFKRLLASPTLSYSGKQALRIIVNYYLTIPGFFVGGTEVNVDLSAPRALIMARGTQVALTELCGQLCWLGAVLRASPRSSGISTPSISITRSSTSVAVRMACSVTDYEISVDEGGGTCWHSMFLNNPLIVNSFPIS
jgi:hypothetical protein